MISLLVLYLAWIYLTTLKRGEIRREAGDLRTNHDLLIVVRNTFRSAHNSELLVFIASVLMGLIVISMSFAVSLWFSGGLMYSNIEMEPHFGDALFLSLSSMTPMVPGNVQPLGVGKLILSVETVVGLLFQVLVISLVVSYVTGLAEYWNR